MKTCNIVLPTFYTTFLLYGDGSGLSDDDQQTIEEFIDIRGCEYNLFYCIGVSKSSELTDRHALFSHGIGLVECSTFIFQIEG